MSLMSSIKNRWDLIALRMKVSRKQRSSKNSNVVIIDNTSEKGNWLINKSNVPVTVCCNEAYGHFSVDLRAGQKQLITWDVRANVYSKGDKSYDDLKYHIGINERWEIHNSLAGLIMVKR